MFENGLAGTLETSTVLPCALQKGWLPASRGKPMTKRSLTGRPRAHEVSHI